MVTMRTRSVWETCFHSGSYIVTPSQVRADTGGEYDHHSRALRENPIGPAPLLEVRAIVDRTHVVQDIVWLILCQECLKLCDHNVVGGIYV